MCFICLEEVAVEMYGTIEMLCNTNNTKCV